MSNQNYSKTRLNLILRRSQILQSSCLNGCGCLEDNKCNDPWHKDEYRLIVQDAGDLEGWARFPWGASRVYRETAKTSLWWVDADDKGRVGYGETSTHPGAAKHNDAVARAASPERVAARKARREARETQRTLDLAIEVTKYSYDRICKLNPNPATPRPSWAECLAVISNNPHIARALRAKIDAAIAAL